MNQYIFPDIEVELVDLFNNYLGEITRVGTKKLPGNQSGNEIVITAAYSGDKERTLKFAGIVLDIYSLDNLIIKDKMIYYFHNQLDRIILHQYPERKATGHGYLHQSDNPRILLVINSDLEVKTADECFHLLYKF